MAYIFRTKPFNKGKQKKFIYGYKCYVLDTCGNNSLCCIGNFCKISYITLAVIIGYVAVIPGYFGAVMYIYRNTTPKDVE